MPYFAFSSFCLSKENSLWRIVLQRISHFTAAPITLYCVTRNVIPLRASAALRNVGVYIYIYIYIYILPNYVDPISDIGREVFTEYTMNITWNAPKINATPSVEPDLESVWRASIVRHARARALASWPTFHYYNSRRRSSTYTHTHTRAPALPWPLRYPTDLTVSGARMRPSLG